MAIYSPWVIPAVSRIYNNRVKWCCRLDIGRSQDRINEFTQIDTRDQIAPLQRDNLEAEDELQNRR